MNTRRAIRIMVYLSLLSLAAYLPFLLTDSAKSSAQSGNVGQNAAEPVAAPAARQKLESLRAATNNQLTANVSRSTGVYSFVRATGSAVLSADSMLTAPETRARAFLGSNGALVGMTSAERSLATNPSAANTTAASALQVASINTDQIGSTHVKFDQTYQGLKVFGAQLVVHMNTRGITAVNGNFIPGIALSKTPKVTAAKANQIAIASATKAPDASLAVKKNELAVYHMGLLEGYKGRSVLAYAVEVAGPQMREQIWINAQTGNVINRIPLRNDVLHRIVYTPSYDSANPNSNKVKEEGDLTPTPPPPADPVNNLFHYTGQIYNLFRSAFGRDSYDGVGADPQRTVLLVNDQCPNAYWDGQTTNYCPDFDKDDVVAHEWGHAYTQYTHNLVYAYQSGALNESYSDIFGESLDLNNGADGAGGTNNGQITQYTIQNGQYAPSGGGVRWRIGEDVQGLSQPAALGILRDMWTPEAFQDPPKVSSDLYYCGSDQSTAVHTNSAVPNKAFALLVDGGSYNGQTVTGIGFTRALAIYYRAMTVYQISSTNFPEHEQALQASCRDLINAPLTNFSTSTAVGTPSTDVITIGTCDQVSKAMTAVEMSTPPVQCNYQKLLDPNTPAECNGSNTFFVEDWETGMDGWTVNNQGTGDSWPGTNWTLKSNLPANPDSSAHSGTAAYAINPAIGETNGGTCAPGGDVSGQFWIDSPTITIPAGAADAKLKFDHFVQTEGGADGGNVKISVNGGAFTLVPQSEYIFNGPRETLLSTADGNTNPKQGEFAWTGTNQGELSGSWGTTIINLANLTSPGDTVKIRFDFGQDGCNGSLGWLVDTVRLYSCPVLEGPTLFTGADYENPDVNGFYSLNWTRPANATGPDTLQESTSCGPVFTDDASAALVGGQNVNWAGSAQWVTQPNPSDSSTAYYIPDGASQNESLTMKNAVTIPAGASSTLTFTTRQGLEDGYDFGHVEVSTDGGANFVEVASYTGPELNIDPLTVFEGTRTINLSQFAGQSIKVRFRVTSDPFNIGQPAGWYVDNIAITASNFQTVAGGLTGTSYSFSNKPEGNYCYRVNSTYTIASELAQSPFSNIVNVTVDLPCATPSNLALGATATPSSTYVNGGFPASSAVDGEHKGLNWGNNGGWNDNTRDVWPDQLEIAFNGSKTLTSIIVYTVQNDFRNPVEPTPLTPANFYGIEDFEVQTWNGSAWVTVPGGSVTGNDKAMRLFPVPAINTTKIRVVVTKARSNWTRIVEVEALGCP